MSRTPLLLLACVSIAAGALAACAPDTLPPPEGSAASASPTTGGPLDGTPEPNNELAGNPPSDQPPTRYECNNGDTVTVHYPDPNHARITYQDNTRSMHIAVSADGARYVGSGYEWWTRGAGDNAEATLFTHRDDGSTGDVVATCEPDNGSSF